MENIHPKGLQPLPYDERDLRLGSVFSLGDIKEVPKKNFIVGTLRVKDQKNTDFCSGYTVSQVSATQEGDIDMSPEFQFGKTKELMGDDEWGADLRSACKSAVKVGSLPQIIWDSVFGAESHYDRDLVLKVEEYPSEWNELSAQYRKKSFWAITGEYDAFDNIRLALWKNRNEKCEIVTGAIWRQAWTKAKGGIIKTSGDPTGGSGHAFSLVGQKIINGDPYIVARLSNGKNIGDDGIFYFSRKVINTEVAKYGLFMFKDMDKETAKVMNENEWKDSSFTRLIAQIVVLIKKLYARR